MDLIKDLSSLVTAAMAIVAMIAVMKYRIGRSEKEEEKTGLKLDGIVDEFHELLVEIEGFTREQKIVNKFTASTLEVITKKVEEVEYVLAERSQLIGLVQELLKRLDNVNIEP